MRSFNLIGDLTTLQDAGMNRRVVTPHFKPGQKDILPCLSMNKTGSTHSTFQHYKSCWKGLVVHARECGKGKVIVRIHCFYLARVSFIEYLVCRRRLASEYLSVLHKPVPVEREECMCSFECSLTYCTADKPTHVTASQI